MHELIGLKKEHVEFLQRLKLVTGGSNGRGSALLSNDAFSDVERLVDELRVRRDEAMSYKSQLSLLHQQLEHEK